MNERQRILMQKIVEYGDVKLQWGMNLQRLGRAYGDVQKSSELFDQINQMVTEWVGESDTDASVGSCREPSEELGVELGRDTSVVPATTFGKHFTRGTRRKKDELDREVGL